MTAGENRFRSPVASSVHWYNDSVAQTRISLALALAFFMVLIILMVRAWRRYGPPSGTADWQAVGAMWAGQIGVFTAVQAVIFFLPDLEASPQQQLDALDIGISNERVADLLGVPDTKSRLEEQVGSCPEQTTYQTSYSVGATTVTIASCDARGVIGFSISAPNTIQATPGSFPIRQTTGRPIVLGVTKLSDVDDHSIDRYVSTEGSGNFLWVEELYQLSKAEGGGQAVLACSKSPPSANKFEALAETAPETVKQQILSEVRAESTIDNVTKWAYDVDLTSAPFSLY